MCNNSLTDSYEDLLTRLRKHLLNRPEILSVDRKDADDPRQNRRVARGFSQPTGPRTVRCSLAFGSPARQISVPGHTSPAQVAQASTQMLASLVHASHL